jgi:hypothetical protein
MPMFKANQYLVDTAMPFTTGGGGMSEGSASATAPAGNSVESVEQQESRQHDGNSGHKEHLSYDKQREQKEKYISLYVDKCVENFDLRRNYTNLERVATWWESECDKLTHDLNKLAAENKRLQEENERLQEENERLNALQPSS